MQIFTYICLKGCRKTEVNEHNQSSNKSKPMILENIFEIDILQNSLKHCQKTEM